MNVKAVDFNEKFALFSERWSPKIIGKINNYLVKTEKIEGDLIWHKHADTDELFIVSKGVLRVDLKEEHVYVKAGQMCVVPKGAEHCTHVSCCRSSLLCKRAFRYDSKAENKS